MARLAPVYTLLVISLILSAIQVQVRDFAIIEQLDDHTSFPIIIESQISNENVVATGNWTLGPCNAVFVDEELAYIGNGRHMEILNISNPALPTHVSSVFLGYVVEGIHAEGDYVYAACRLGGLQIIDIENILAPKRISDLRTPAWAVGV